MIAYLEDKNVSVEVPDDISESDLQDVQKNFSHYFPESSGSSPVRPEPSASRKIEEVAGNVVNELTPKWVPDFYESTIKPLIPTMGPEYTPLALLATPESRSVGAGLASGLTFGAAKPLIPQDVKKEQAEHPMYDLEGELIGGLGSLLATGGALRIAGLGAKAAEIGAKAATKIAAAPRFIPPAIMTGATFGTQSFISKTVKGFQDGGIDPVDFGKSVIKDTVLGSFLGGVSGLSNSYVAVASASGLGFVSAKMDGAENDEALLHGGIWGMFELVGSFGREARLRSDVLKRVMPESIGEYVAKKNPSITPEQATGIGRAIVENEAAKVGGVDKIVQEGPEGTLQLIEGINQKIRQGKIQSTPKAVEPPQLTVQGVKPAEPTITPEPPETPLGGIGSKPGEAVEASPRGQNVPIQSKFDNPDLYDFIDRNQVKTNDVVRVKLFRSLDDDIPYKDVEGKVIKILRNKEGETVSGMKVSGQVEVPEGSSVQLHIETPNGIEIINTNPDQVQKNNIQIMRGKESVTPIEPTKAQKPIKYDREGIPIRKPNDVVSSIETPDGHPVDITHQMVLDEAEGLLEEEKFIRELKGNDALTQFVIDNGGLKSFKPDVTGKVPEAEEMRSVPVRFKNSVQGLPADEMAQMAFDQGLMSEPSADMLREHLKSLQTKGDAPKLSQFYDQALRKLENDFSSIELPAAAYGESVDYLFSNLKENIADRYNRLRQEAINRGIGPAQASKWAKAQLVGQPIPQEGMKPKQSEFGSGGVESFGKGKKGENDLFEPSAEYGDQRKVFEDKALNHFGETKDLKSAGFLLRDGRMIDFTEGNLSGVGAPRLYDHREVASIYGPRTYETDTSKLYDFMGKTGAVRVNSYPERGGEHLTFESQLPLSSDQLKQIEDYMASHNVTAVSFGRVDRFGSDVGSDVVRNPTVEDVARFFNGTSMAAEKPGNLQQQELSLSPYEEDQLSKEQGKTPAEKPAMREGFRAIQGSRFETKFRKVGAVIVPNQKIGSPADVAFVFRQFRNPVQENFFLIALKKGKIVGVEHLGFGTIDQVAVYPFNTLHILDKTQADSAYIAHNHPSGEVNPSEEDKRLTSAIRDTLFTHGVRLDGHVIIDDTKFGFIDPDGRITTETHKQYSETKKMSVLQKYFEWKDGVEGPGALLTSPEKVYELQKGIQVDPDEGLVWLLDAQNRVINTVVIPKGKLTPKVMQKIVVAYRPAGFITANAGLSQQDVRYLKDAMRRLDVRYQDDIEFNKEFGYKSKLEYGMMETKGEYSAGGEQGRLKENYPSSKAGNRQFGGPEDQIVALKKSLGGLEFIKKMKGPELVKLAKEISGNVPVIKKMISALGYFSPTGERIALNPEIFKDPKLWEAVLAHEIGHLMDFQPDKTMKRGNILGRIGSFKHYLKSLLPEGPESKEQILTPKDRARFRAEAERIAKGKPSDPKEPDVLFDPQMVLDVWNKFTPNVDPSLLEYIKGIDAEKKKSLIKAAMLALKNGEKIEIYDVNKFNKDAGENPQRVADIYKDLIKKEIKKRKLWEEEVIREELKNLTQYWKPFNASIDPGYTGYRFSSPELYADFISVLLNAPAKAADIAPQTFEAYFNYIGNKKDVLTALFELQTLIQGTDEDLQRSRFDDIHSMWNKADQIFLERQKKLDDSRKSLVDLMNLLFWDKNATLLKENEKLKAGKELPLETDMEFAIGKYSMIAPIVRSYMEDLDQLVYTPAQEGDVLQSVKDILFLERVEAERAEGGRSEMANPLGHSPESAKEALDFLQKTDPGKYAIASRLADEARNWLKGLMKIKGAENLYTPEQIALINMGDKYAPFRVIDFAKDYISASLIGQIGTLRDIGDPLTSLAMKGASVITAITKNEIKRSVGNGLIQTSPEMRPLKVNQEPGRFSVEQPKENYLDSMAWKENGRWVAFAVDRSIADLFNNSTTPVIGQVAGVINFLLNNNFFRKLWITFSPGFQAVNLIRDFFQTWQQAPGMTILDALKSYAAALPAAKSRAKGLFDPLIQEMERSGALQMTMNDLILGQTSEDREFESFLEKYDVVKKPEGKYKNIPIVRQLSDFLDFLRYTGDTIETMSKVVGWMYLEKWPEAKRANFVRNYIGTPNFKRSGTAMPAVNAIFLFANIWKEGVRNMIELSFRGYGDKLDYWRKHLILSIMPKIFMAMAAAGYFGLQIKRGMDKFSEYQKTNYLCLPIGMDDAGNVVGVRIPMNETSRLIGGIFWKMISYDGGLERNLTDLLDFGSGQFPNLSPTLTTVNAWSTYLSGGNPRDQFRQQDILTEQEKVARGTYALEPMVRWTINQVGLARMDVHDRLKTEPIYKTVSSIIPILNRFLVITQAGDYERLGAAGKKVAMEDARKALDVQNMAREAIRSGKSLYEFMGQAKTAEDLSKYKNAYKNQSKKSTDQAIVRALNSASSEKQKLAILDEAMKDYASKNEFIHYVDSLFVDNIINGTVAAKAQSLWRDRK